jgi:hypothetical protein
MCPSLGSTTLARLGELVEGVGAHGQQLCFSFATPGGQAVSWHRQRSRHLPATHHRGSPNDPQYVSQRTEPRERAGQVRRHASVSTENSLLRNGPEIVWTKQFRCPQPGTILMGYPPLLLSRELPQWLQIQPWITRIDPNCGLLTSLRAVTTCATFPHSE